MQAIRQYEFGAPEVLRYESIADPEPAAGQARIRVEAAGVHLIDTTIRTGESFGSLPPPALPMTPGREVAGVVDRVGPGVDPDLVGERAVAHLGPDSGGYAELALAQVDRLHPIPDGVDAATAVAAIGTGRTAAGILRLAPLQADDVALVTSAAGGLGVLLLQQARHVGARAIGLAGGERKLAVAKGHGADLAVDYRDPDWPDRLHGERPTVVYDGVGGPAGRAAYDLLVPGGRLVRFGWSSGVRNAYQDPERLVLDVLGPRMSGLPGGIPALEAEALAAAADGTRVPYVGATFPLADAAAAHRALEARQTSGKVVLLPGTMAG